MKRGELEDEAGRGVLNHGGEVLGGVDQGACVRDLAGVVRNGAYYY